MGYVIASFKSLLKPESPRDIGDLVLSFKHPPNVIISDIPHMVAQHINKREPNFFGNFQGRVAQACTENIKLAEEGNFPVQSFPWIERRNQKAIEGIVLNNDRVSSHMHPINLTTHRLSVYDRFHQKK